MLLDSGESKYKKSWFVVGKYFWVWERAELYIHLMNNLIFLTIFNILSKFVRFSNHSNKLPILKWDIAETDIIT